ASRCSSPRWPSTSSAMASETPSTRAATFTSKERFNGPIPDPTNFAGPVRALADDAHRLRDLLPRPRPAVRRPRAGWPGGHARAGRHRSPATAPEPAVVRPVLELPLRAAARQPRLRLLQQPGGDDHDRPGSTDHALARGRRGHLVADDGPGDR